MIVPVNATTVVNYSVYAFSSGYNSGGVYRTDVTNLAGGDTRVYANANLQGGGYYVVLPPNDSSGYLIVAGYYPIYATKADSTSWSSAFANSYVRLLPYAFLTSDVTFFLADRNVNSDSPLAGDSFSGIIYIPAHSTTLYLVIQGYSYTTLSGYFGVQKTYNASVHFVPDPDVTPPNYTSALNELNAKLQALYNLIASQNGNIDGIVSQLSSIVDSLSSIAEQLTSSSEMNSEAEAIVEQMEQLQDRIDELTQQIEENTNRPPPEDLVPSIPPVMVSPSDPAAIDGRKAISDILSSSFLTTFLVMVFSLAFLRYVLFGKSK